MKLRASSWQCRGPAGGSRKAQRRWSWAMCTAARSGTRRMRSERDLSRKAITVSSISVTTTVRDTAAAGAAAQATGPRANLAPDNCLSSRLATAGR
eukprot:scaffold2600_cov103-Isochrysis_galbana.AAC.8